MRLFISYAHADVAQVKGLVDIFRAGGHDPWFDHKLLPGQDWQAELLAAITVCDAFVYALTPDSVNSEWCRWEFSRAVEMGKPVVPVLLRKTGSIPKELSRFQYADVSEGFSPVNIAQIMGGLTHISAFRIQAAPDSPANPRGKPAQAAGTTHVSPAIFTPPDLSHILPPPFEWCEVPAGRVTIEYGLASTFATLKLPRLETFDTQEFYISKYPVTVGQFQAFIDAPDGFDRHSNWHHPISKKRFGKPRSPSTIGLQDDYPMVVNWYEAIAFCNWLTSRTAANKNMIITLPSEQEWQRAGQGDDNRMFPWGNEFDTTKFNLRGTSDLASLTPVTMYADVTSPYGVMDMIGNLGEWTRTSYGMSVIPLVAPSMVYRGGAHTYHNVSDMRLTARNSAEANVRRDMGFRLVYTNTR